MKVDYIAQGDCLELLRGLPDNSIDLVITDPPYLYDAPTGGGAFGREKQRYHNEYAKVCTFKRGIDQRKANQRSGIGSGMVAGFDVEILDELRRVMKKVNIYIWCSKSQILGLLEYFRGYNFEILTWHKTNPIPTCNNTYLSDTEYLLFFREKGAKIYGSYATKRKYYISPTNKADKDKYKHPTIKPLNIIENLIINSADVGGVVLDPFLGSGTTAVAAINTNRHYIGFEINPEYCEIAKQRINEVKK